MTLRMEEPNHHNPSTTQNEAMPRAMPMGREQAATKPPLTDDTNVPNTAASALRNARTASKRASVKVAHLLRARTRLLRTRHTIVTSN